MLKWLNHYMKPPKGPKVEETAFGQIKHAFLSAPALALPDINKQFFLCVYKRKGVAKELLTQKLGP